MKAYLIDPFVRTVREIEYDGNYKTIYRHIGNDCDVFDAVNLTPKGDTVFVDDEGLLKPGLMGFTIKGYPQPLFGRGLVLGTDDEGESIAPRMSLQRLTELVHWTDLITTGGQ